MTGIKIDNQHYDILGNNLYRNTRTKKVASGDQIAANNRIYLGSGNDLRGASIGNKTVTICPKCAFKGWEKTSKIALFLGTGIAIAGIATAAAMALPFIASALMIGAGILAIIYALFEIKVIKPTPT